MTHQELRERYLAFFRSKGHAVIPSAPVVPLNDPTVLFTTAGMHPLVPYLLGEPHPAGTRIADVQKCIRTGDIDDVGDDTHLTFFEMLGNWSFGDYFKQEAISWSFEFLTSSEWLGIPLERLAFTCFVGDEHAPKDEEAAGIWRSLGVPEERIAFLGRDDNWWGPAGTTGPCGPDTEMFYWIDNATPAPERFNPSDKRWVEIWNDVFMQYRKTESGSYEKLAKPNVDTGMGLERTLTVLTGKRSVYETELFVPLLAALREQATLEHEHREKFLRIQADHLRAAAFMMTDGVEPTNKDRGYVLRRLLRRSMVYARQLGMHEYWWRPMMDALRGVLGGVYPELVANEEVIDRVITAEDKKFSTTLDKGLREFGKLEVIDGEAAFNLYQTYGFPWELTYELAHARGLSPDRGAFELAFTKHKDLSRTASAGTFKGGLADHSEVVVRYHTATHLMHQALRTVLGDHVIQKGSNINAERTRFDFSHPQKVTPEELHRVEELVNGWIQRDLPVTREMMSQERARELGAIGAFGEKYGDTVSVYTVEDPATHEVVSREFCGGPHVEHTGVIGHFRILKEEAVSAGIRRIKAVLE
ncbi:MAG: alanine--tRNA ligase [Candidatus Yanofskybacteria bacterium]|nr:alanine--tRNA ligase [Candidatus Yanofskybacteria bacterium]